MSHLSYQGPKTDASESPFICLQQVVTKTIHILVFRSRVLKSGVLKRREAPGCHFSQPQNTIKGLVVGIRVEHAGIRIHRQSSQCGFRRCTAINKTKNIIFLQLHQIAIQMKYKGPRLDLLRDAISFMNRSNMHPDILVMLSCHLESMTGDQVHSNSKVHYAASPIDDVNHFSGFCIPLTFLWRAGFKCIFGQVIPQRNFEGQLQESADSELVRAHDAAAPFVPGAGTCRTVCCVFPPYLIYLD